MKLNEYLKDLLEVILIGFSAVIATVVVLGTCLLIFGILLEIFK